MIPGGIVQFEHEWEREHGDDCDYVMLSVKAKVSALYPAVMYLSNGDPGYPAEGGEVEDLTARLPDGTELNPIPDTLYDVLCQRATEQHERM